MKKFYALALLMVAGLSASAQTNIVVNGNFENWTDATTLANFSTFTSNITQESTIKHGGEFSAKQAAPASGNFPVQNDVTGIIPGHSYTISYYFLDNDPGARSRMWSGWIDSDGGTNGAPLQLPDHADQLRINENTSYSVDNPQWQFFTVTLTAPAAADAFRFQTRTYKEGTGGGFIYYDDFSIVDNTVAGLKDNSIAGFKMYPNPLSGNVLNITSNSTADKTVAIFDVLGKQVVNAKVANGTVNVSNLTAGVYIVKVTEEGKTATRKLVVK